MATVKIERATVEKVFQNGNAMKIVEWVKIQGGDVPQRYTVWFGRPHGKNEGDIIGVVGVQTHKMGQFQGSDGETVKVVEVSVNDPQLLDAQQPQATPVQSTLDVMENAPF